MLRNGSRTVQDPNLNGNRMQIEPLKNLFEERFPIRIFWAESECKNGSMGNGNRMICQTFGSEPKPKDIRVPFWVPILLISEVCFKSLERFVISARQFYIFPVLKASLESRYPAGRNFSPLRSDIVLERCAAFMETFPQLTDLVINTLKLVNFGWKTFFLTFLPWTLAQQCLENIQVCLRIFQDKKFIL